jgi:hypothetical protein
MDSKSEAYGVFQDLVANIMAQQIRETNKYWELGSLPSIRKNKFWFYRRPDNSAFYTAWVHKLLKEMQEQFCVENKVTFSIFEASCQNLYPKYENPTHGNSYNFYPTKPSKHFGNGLIFKHFKHFQLTDDADDTALLYEHNPDKSLVKLCELLEIHSKGNSASLAKAHKNLELYSTWFGVKMPLEYDLVVQCNILCLFLSSNKNLPTKATKTLEHILLQITEGQYLTKPYLYAPHYAHEVVIAYHLARLLYYGNITTHKEILLAQLEQLAIKYKNNSMYALLIDSSQARLGRITKVHIKPTQTALSGFSYFLAGLLTAYPQAWLRTFKTNRFFHIRWYCFAHSQALYAENLFLKGLKDKP